MINQLEKQRREEYKLKKAKLLEIQKKNAEAIAEQMRKAKTCQCGYFPIKRKTRKNWPFGRKSKPRITTIEYCPNCRKEKLIK